MQIYLVASVSVSSDSGNLFWPLDLVGEGWNNEKRRGKMVRDVLIKRQ